MLAGLLGIFARNFYNVILACAKVRRVRHVTTNNRAQTSPSANITCKYLGITAYYSFLRFPNNEIICVSVTTSKISVYLERIDAIVLRHVSIKQALLYRKYVTQRIGKRCFCLWPKNRGSVFSWSIRSTTQSTASVYILDTCPNL